MKKSLGIGIIIILALIMILAIYFIPKKDFNAGEPLINSTEARAIRFSTIENCDNLIDQTINFKGKVLYETCNKNCLGGCPNSGPLYCYYGIQDKNGCLAYLKSRITTMDWTETRETFNTYHFGKEVSIRGKIILYHAPYCTSCSDKQLQESTYLLITE